MKFQNDGDDSYVWDGGDDFMSTMAILSGTMMVIFMTIVTIDFDPVVRSPLAYYGVLC
jgi:hypothetical protein